MIVLRALTERLVCLKIHAFRHHIALACEKTARALRDADPGPEG
jgi:hypothetical protein